ncbi:MAG: O-antigen ligase family protein [Candidatus Omnitrophica bacterium]|nr:O-antigen ligase family protein [Candidatus Omnitrophota bacterium]
MLLKRVFNFFYISFLVSQLCLASIYIYDIPLRAYFIAAGFIVCVIMLIFFESESIWNNAYIRNISFLFIGFAFSSFMAFLISRVLYDNTLSLKSFLFLLTRFLIQLWIAFFISSYFLKQNGIVPLLWSVMLYAALSGLVAFFQFLGIETFWKMKFLFTTDLNKYIVTFITSHTDSQRAAGLSLYFISLSYEMLLSLPLGIYLITRSAGKWRWLAVFCSIMILLGLVASKTMSAYLALTIMLLLWFYGKGKRKITISLIFLILIGSYIFRDHFTFLLASLKARMGFWQVAIKTFLKYPFGIPFLREYGRYSSQFYSPDLPDIVGSVPHNQFLNTVISYGLGGIICLFLFFFLLYKRAMKIHDNHLALLMVCAFSGYFVHSFFHNLGMFYNDVFFWVFAAVFFVQPDHKNG